MDFSGASERLAFGMAHLERFWRFEGSVFARSGAVRARVFHQSCVIGAARELLDTLTRGNGLNLEKRLLYSI